MASDLRKETRTSYTGGISEIIGYKRFDDGRLSICVLGKLRSFQEEETQIEVLPNRKEGSKRAELMPYTKFNGDKWLYPAEDEVKIGCDDNTKIFNDNTLVLDSKQQRAIIFKSGENNTTILTKHISEKHFTKAQLKRKKTIDFLNAVTKPGQIIVFYIMIYTGNGPTV